jgi:hypothetical protein
MSDELQIRTLMLNPMQIWPVPHDLQHFLILFDFCFSGPSTSAKQTDKSEEGALLRSSGREGDQWMSKLTKSRPNQGNRVTQHGLVA